MYVRLCCCKYLSLVLGQLQKRLLRAEEAPSYLLVTTQHGVRAQAPVGPADTGPARLSLPWDVSSAGATTPPVSTFPTPSLQKTGYQVRSKRPQELGAEVERWAIPRGHRSTGLLLCPLQSPD